MQLPTLSLTREEARGHAATYRKARRDGHSWTHEDQRMLQAYVAISRGEPVVDLHRAIALGGTLDMEYEWPTRDGFDRRAAQLPAIAVARADRRFVWTSGVDRAGDLHMRSQMRPHHANTRDLLNFPQVFERDDTRSLDRRSRDAIEWRGTYAAWRAMVPPPPVHLRPLNRRGEPADLGEYFTLWEAEWAIDRTVPPGDPALLKHLGGTLYRVIATWDLTPVEQAVLAGRTPNQHDLRGAR